MVQTKSKSVLSQSVDGDKLVRTGSKERKNSKAKKSDMLTSPLKFFDSNVDGVCRQCTKGIDDAKEDSINYDRYDGCIHVKCAEMTKQEFQYIRRPKTPNSYSTARSALKILKEMVKTTGSHNKTPGWTA